MGKVITLRRRKDFERLFSQGRRFNHKLLTTVVLVREDALPTRAAFIVGGKIGNAVRRNKLRRRLREVWRRLIDEIDRPADVAFVAHPPAATATYAQLSALIGDQVYEAGLINRHPIQ